MAYPTGARCGAASEILKFWSSHLTRSARSSEADGSTESGSVFNVFGTTRSSLTLVHLSTDKSDVETSPQRSRTAKASTLPGHDETTTSLRPRRRAAAANQAVSDLERAIEQSLRDSGGPAQRSAPARDKSHDGSYDNATREERGANAAEPHAEWPMAPDGESAPRAKHDGVRLSLEGNANTQGDHQIGDKPWPSLSLSLSLSLCVCVCVIFQVQNCFAI